MTNIQKEIELKKKEIELLESMAQIGEHVPNIQQLIYAIKSSNQNLEGANFRVAINKSWVIMYNDITCPYNDYDGQSRLLILKLLKNGEFHSYYAIPGWYSSYSDTSYDFTSEQLYKCEPITKTIVEWERVY